MFAFFKWLVVRLAVVRWVLKALGGFAILLPLAWLLKIVGLPVLMVLGVLALPVLFVLLILGLPIFMVLLVGGGILAFLFAFLSIGLVVVKVALVVVLPIWIAVKLFKWVVGSKPTPPPPAADTP